MLIIVLGWIVELEQLVGLHGVIRLLQLILGVVRDHKLGASQKRDFGTFLGHFSFWVSGVKSPLIFYTKK